MRTERTIRAIARVQFVVATLIGLAAPASAQDWPSRNITVIVPLGAGSATDVMTRVVMDQVGKQIGRTIIVENRPGAGGRVAIEALKSAPRDGSILLLTPLATMTLYPHVYKSLRYDPLHDFIPVTTVSAAPSRRCGASTFSYMFSALAIAMCMSRYW